MGYNRVQMKRRVANPETIDADLFDLRAFCAVVDAGSITAAAKAIGETKGSVSRRMTRLEESVGVRLLRRSSRVVQATEDGAAYRLRVGTALDALADANNALRQTRDEPRGHLRVTAPVDLGVTMLGPLVAAFTDKYPEITVEMLLTPQVLDFETNQVDVALRAASSLSDSNLVAQKISALSSAFYAAPEYVKAHPKVRTPADLGKHKLLIARATRGQAELALRHTDGTKTVLSVRAAISAADYSFTREAALGNGGIALLPTIVSERDVERGALVRVLRDYVLDGTNYLYFVHGGTRFLQPKVRAFRDFLLADCAVQKASRS